MSQRRLLWLCAVACLVVAAAARAQEAGVGSVPTGKTFNGSGFEYRAADLGEQPEYVVKKVTFPSPMKCDLEANNTVHGEYYLPRVADGKPKRPGVLALHILGGDFAFARMACSVLARRGIPAMMIKLPYYGERKAGLGRVNIQQHPKRFSDAMPQAIQDIRRALDFLASRSEVDEGKLGVFGVSLGALMGATASAQDERASKMMFLLGGGDLQMIIGHAHETWRLREALGKLPEADRKMMEEKILSIDPLKYAEKLKARARAGRVLMVNASEDEVIPPECTRKLARALGIEDKVVWRAGMGHYTMMALIPQLMSQMADYFAADLPEGIRAAQKKAPADMTPVERVCAVIGKITGAIAEPAPGKCHFTQLSIEIKSGKKTRKGNLRYIRGNGSKFALQGRLPFVKSIGMGCGEYPWMACIDKKRVFVGSDSPLVSGSPLMYASAKNAMRIPMAGGILAGLAMSPGLCLQYADFEEVKEGDSIAIRIKVKKKVKAEFLLRLKEDGVSPAAVEFANGKFGKVKILFEQWELSAPAPDEMFASPAGMQRMDVLQKDVYGMFSAIFDFGMESLR